MVATKPRPYITPALIRAVPTGIDADVPVTRRQISDGSARAGWQRVIDNTLMAWLRNPSQLEDEDIEPPSDTIIRLSIDLAETFRDRELPAPDSVVPDPNGGVVFERREGKESEVFHVWDDGAIEYMRFEGTRLVERNHF